MYQEYKSVSQSLQSVGYDVAVDIITPTVPMKF